jgi:Phospholipid N-methyltransferase
MRDTRTFMAAILRRPKELGAIAPSSKALARRAAVRVPASGSPVVVELGPGGGVITDEIRSRLPRSGRLIAVEASGEMVRHLRETRPWLHVIHGDARQLTKFMRDEGLDRADSIIATLPWTVLGDEAQIDLLRQITRLLAPDGTFCTVLTLTAWPLPIARRFRQRLGAAFGEVETTRPVWGNIPPAMLYVCARPRVPEVNAARDTDSATPPVDPGDLPGPHA